MAKTILGWSQPQKIEDGESVARKPMGDIAHACKKFKDDSNAVFVSDDMAHASVRLNFHIMVKEQHRTITLDIPIDNRGGYLPKDDFNALLGALCDMQKYLDIVGRLEG